MKMRGFFSDWLMSSKKLFTDKSYIFNLVFALGLSILAYFSNKFASEYVDSIETTPVGDLFFKIIPATDLSFLFVYAAAIGPLVMLFYGLFCKVEKIPFFIKSISLFTIVRSLCIPLTHIGAPIEEMPVSIEQFDGLFYQNDLFFSGHVGIAFLLFLLIENKWLKRFFFFGSVVMAYTVIATRYHYSIDVVGAFFITYGVYRISCYFFDPESGKWNLFLRKKLDN